MKITIRILAILFALSVIGGIQSNNPTPLFIVIRFILTIIFLYLGWRPDKKKDTNSLKVIDENYSVLDYNQQKNKRLCFNCFKSK